MEVHRNFWGNFAFGILGREAGYSLEQLEGMSYWGDALLDFPESPVSTGANLVVGLADWEYVKSPGDPNDETGIRQIKEGFSAYPDISGKAEKGNLKDKDIFPYIKNIDDNNGVL